MLDLGKLGPVCEFTEPLLEVLVLTASQGLGPRQNAGYIRWCRRRDSAVSVVQTLFLFFGFAIMKPGHAEVKESRAPNYC
jgi:hypothetical protein